jgi:hypothetical protein
LGVAREYIKAMEQARRSDVLSTEDE